VYRNNTWQKFYIICTGLVYTLFSHHCEVGNKNDGTWVTLMTQYSMSESCCTNLSHIHTYTSISNATLFFIYSSSLLYVLAIPGHHQATVYLAKTRTLYFPLYLKMNSKLKYVNVVPFDITDAAGSTTKHNDE
jgi:hypothetical protein